MNIKPGFKNVNYNEWINVEIDKTDLKMLTPKDFVLMSISGKISRDKMKELTSNTSTDIQIEIKDLEINGKKVENTNEN